MKYLDIGSVLIVLSMAVYCGSSSISYFEPIELNMIDLDAVMHKTCKNVDPIARIDELVLPDCGPGPTCTLKRGTNATIGIKFTPLRNVTTVTAKVYGKVGPASIPFPLPHEDACVDSGLTCPLISGQQYLYQVELEVRQEYPAISVVVKWELISEDKQYLVCEELMAHVV